MNGALVPDYQSVSVNPETGAIFAYSNFSRAYNPPPTPAIDRESAEAIAKQQVDAAQPWRTRSVELMVDFDEAGVQQLIWSVALDDGRMSAAVEVDAMTGVARIVGRG
jgi:hypothetical protein